MNDFKYKAVITDVSGIKLDLINEINSCLRADLEFVGGHPMAGSHFRGFDHANPNLFMDANYIITPTDTSSLEAIRKIKGLAKILGCKSISEINPGKHDEAMALASHMPHITALALMDMCDVREMGALLGPSFKDATRVAQINSRLWAQLLISNKENLDEQIKIMEKKMEQLRKAIISSDIKELEHLMEQAGSKKEEDRLKKSKNRA
jgi:Prephenate dehydrogenase